MDTQLLLWVGLALSLLGAPAALTAFRKSGSDTLSLAPRLALWLIAALVVLLATRAEPRAIDMLGVPPLSIDTLALGILAVLVIFALGAVAGALQRLLGLPLWDLATFKRICALSGRYRLFIVVTAAVVEEVLYRGYAIGIGQQVFGNIWLAAACSLVAFTGAHSQWQASHLPGVFVAGLALSALYVFTHNLAACIVAHAVVDGVGFLLMPAILKRRATTS